MPDFEQLRQLISNRPEEDRDEGAGTTVNYPDDDGMNYSKAYPQYDQFLKNARDEIINQRLPDYAGNFNYKTIRGNEPLSSIPSALDNAVLSQPATQTPEIKQYLTNLHNKNIYTSDPSNDINRMDLNNQIVNDYVHATHPEMQQNMAGTKDRVHSMNDPFQQQAEEKELLKYQQQIGRELSGVPKSQEPGISENDLLPYYGDAGRYLSATNKIEVSTPFNFATAAHEYLHKADELAHEGYNQDETNVNSNLLNVDDLANDIVHGNNSHINQKLPGQGPHELPPGESAAYYNKIKQLLTANQIPMK